MSFFSWLRNGNHSAAVQRPSRHRPGRKPATFRPRLESLEGRDVPSTLTVTNALDSGAGSLRADLSRGHNGDTIVFAPSLAGQTINLTSGELLVKHNVTIAGPGADKLTISGGSSSRALEVAAGFQLTLSGLAIANGHSNQGGGVYNGGTLTVSGCTFSGNTASDSGGAIYNLGTLTVNDCTLSGNSAYSAGGAIYNVMKATISDSTFSGNGCEDGDGGGIYGFSGTLAVSGCTLSDNWSSDQGGAIFISPTCTVAVGGCTVTNNSASYGYGGGISIATSIRGGGSVTVTNTYFSGNGPSPTFGAIYGPYIDGGGNTFN
jgi:predicted outer membrane repeat protein